MKTVQQEEPQNDPPEEWLLMVHMLASAPNLQRPLGLDLEELSRPLREMRKRAKVVDVRVQVDLPTGVSKRFQLSCDEAKALAVFRTRPNTTLENFVTESIEDKSKNKEKVKTALVVWGHASGIGQGMGRAYGSVSNSLGTRMCPAPAADKAQGGGRKTRQSEAGPTTADELAQELLAPDEVAQAGSVWTQLTNLPADRQLDLVGFDACYMACVEIAFQLRDHVHFLLAPQPGIGLEGWHYDLFLDQIVAGMDRGGERAVITPEELGRRVVAQVGLAASSPQALSLLNLEHLRNADDPDNLVARIRVLTAALQRAYDAPFRESQMRRLVLDAFSAVAWAGVRQFLDLGDLCRVLASRIPDHNVRAAALAVLSGIAPTTLQGNGASSTFRTNGLLVDHLCVLDVPLSGLSIYCPWPRASARLADFGVRNVEVDPREYHRDPDQPGRYPGLDFSRYTGWGDFIFDMQRGQEAERRWVRQEAREQVLHVVADRGGANGWTPFGRADDPKPAGRADDPKPAGRADDPKPAGRADDPKPAGRDDAWTF